MKTGLIQIVGLRWEKSARGGQGSRDRNSVPRSFAISRAELTKCDDSLFIDASHWGEPNAFAEPMTSRRHRVALGDGFRYGCVSVSADSNGLRVRFQYDMGNGGAPDRSYLNWPADEGEVAGRVLLVGPGQWVRVSYNGRFAGRDDGNWYYEQTTLNVAWFESEPDGCAFVNHEPHRELNSLADLW